MPRAPRHIQPGCVYHLISRFVDREWFIQKEQERRDYLELLGRALTSSDWRCLAYAIMSNHIHLAVLAGEDPLHVWIRRVHSPFADAMNRAYARIGPMFVRGPKSLLVEPTGVRDVIAYVHNNPVRAKLVDTASESSWTSHRAYVGLTVVPRWLDVQEGMMRSGFADPADFNQWVAHPARNELDHVHEDVIENVAQPKREESATIDPDAIVSATAQELGISVTQLRSRRRSAIEIRGREAVVVCAQRVGLKGVETARALGVSQQAISLIGGRGIRTEALTLGERVMRRIEADSNR
jgi:REP element-mobilizing transposase RayT